MARIRLVSILRYIYEGKTRADPLTNLRCQDIFIGFNSQILTPLAENLESTENLFEGDMKLSHNQRAAIDGQAGRGSIITRKWTGGVLPYVIHSSLCKKFLFCVMSHLSFFLLLRKRVNGLNNEMLLA